VGNNVCDGPADAHSSQFSLLYPPIVENYPAGSQLGSGVPGGTAYNAVVQGAPGSTVLVRLRVPYPYVTVGANPLQVFDGTAVGTDAATGCFQPGGSVLATSGTQIRLRDYLAICDIPIGLCRNGVGGCVTDNDCVRPNAAGVSCIAPTGSACDGTSGPDFDGGCSFEVNVLLPTSGQAYLNLSLDYGLEGAAVDLCQDGSPERYDWAVNGSVGGLDALESTAPAPPSGDVAVGNCSDYAFRHRVGTGPLFEAVVENFNVFQACTQAGDRDCDGAPDAVDKCPYLAGNDQSKDADADGRGNECECGDQNGDGKSSVADLVAINQAIFNPALATPLCDANNDRLCSVADIVAANAEFFSVGNTSTCAFQPVPGP
jgi:hypothetical protein